MRRWVRNTLIVFLLIFPIILFSLNYLEDVAETNETITFVMSLPQRTVDFVTSGGYAGIFLLMLLEAAALPIPSEIILPFAGYLVFKGDLSFWPVVATSTVAALTGSFVDYYLGRRLGLSLLSDASTLRYINAHHLSTVQAWFNKYGPMAVALFRLVPAARVLISFPAGACRMSEPKFAAYTILGCLPWNMMLVYLGWSLGLSWASVVGAFKYINPVVYTVLMILGILIGLRISRRQVTDHS